MRKIRIIARTELNNLFYSPIAWMLLIIFLIQCGLSFTDSLRSYQISSQYKKLAQMSPDPATLAIMTKPITGMFSQMLTKLYLYLPLLTMGLISRETSSGTIRLLYSSPVKTGEIVLGKFLAMVAYNFLLLLVLTIFAGLILWVIPFADTGMLLSALLGFFLLLCAYAAIGLFMSSLTSYQVVAALSTLSVLAALHYIGTVWQGIDFVRDLTYFLSLSTRTEDFFNGLINSKDILYFVIIISIFLLFAFFRLQGNQESGPLWKRLSRYVGVSFLAVGIGYFSDRPSLTIYQDVTAPKTNTPAPVTQALLQSTGKVPLEIIAYVNLLDINYLLCSPEKRHSYLKFWEPYQRFKQEIKFRYVYYYDTNFVTERLMQVYYKGKTLLQIAQEYAKLNNVDLKDFLSPEQAHKIPGLADENGRFIMQMKYQGRTSNLRVFDDQQQWPSEEQISASLKRIIEPSTVPKIGFLTGSLERDPYQSGDRSYSLITTVKGTRISLINNGFDIDTIGEGQRIPSGLTALVLADPKVALSAETKAKLQRYIADGGNLLLTGEPGKQKILNPILQPLGVQLKDGILVQENKENVPDLVTPALTEVTANISQGAARIYSGHRSIYLPGAVALSYPVENSVAYKIEPLLNLSGDQAWLKMGKLVNDSAAVKFNAGQGDQHSEYFVPAVALTRMVNGHEQRIAVTGDADFMSNQTLQLQKINPIFCNALFKWVSNGIFPVELSRLHPKDLVGEYSDEQMKGIKLVFIWALPGLLAAVAIVMLLRRKRK